MPSGGLPTAHLDIDLSVSCASSDALASAGVNVDTPQSWLHLLDWDPFLKLTPAVVSTLLLMLVMSRFKSPLALPAILVFLPGIFFVVLACLHKSLADAQGSGWVAKPAVGPHLCSPVVLHCLVLARCSLRIPRG